MPWTSAHRAAVAMTSSTTKPSWKRRYSPSGHGCWNRRWSNDVMDAGLARSAWADQHLLHDGRHEVSVGVVDRAPHEAAVARDGERLLRVQVPPVEADRAVEPERVVEAEAGELRGRIALRVRAERHVEQQVVARVREQRRVQDRVVADGARQPHPVRARAVGRGAAEEGRRLADAQVQRGWLLDPVHRVPAQLRGQRRAPSPGAGAARRAPARTVADRRPGGRAGSRGTRP